MKKLLFIYLLVLYSCVPKLPETASVEAGAYTNKANDRKVASENSKNNFNSLSVEMNVRIGDREYIQNVLVDIFGPTADTVTYPFIIQNGMALNGGCSQYEATYTDVATVGSNFIIDDVKTNCYFSDLNIPIIGTENATREGLRIQACEKVVSTTSALFYLIDNVTGVTNNQTTFSTIPTEDHLKKMYNRFYPGREIPQDVLSSLKNLSSSSTIPLAKDKFKLVALTLCMSADWQIP